MPQANFFWNPSGLNYVDALWSGYTGGGLTLIPLSAPDATPRQSFDRNKSVGMPHYMRIIREDGTVGELTALDCTAALRFTYSGKSRYVLLQGAGGRMEIDGRTITGETVGWKGSKTYYIATFEGDFSAERKGKDLLLTFAPSRRPVNVTVAESRISLEQARINFSREAEGRTFDPEQALEYYYDEITYSWVDTLEDRAYNIEHIRGNGRLGFEEYFTKGYISFPQNTKRVIESTSKTIEYNYDDFCAYKLAQMTGNTFWENVFAKHIYNYRNVFDPSDGFFKGRDATGAFDEDFNPYEWGGPLVEGNAWQWRFAVQQDAAGMMDLMGGEQAFIDNLDEIFAAPADSSLDLWGGYGFRIHEITEAAAGGQGQYAQANEPCFHVIHLYSHAGQPWKGQPKLRDSLQRLFDSSAKGFPGDEDGGAMSSWYIFNCMGFYPVTPGVAEYTFGSPLFDKITIHLEDGKDFVIEVENNAPDHVYISSVQLNGEDYAPSFLRHEDIMNGGKLTFIMSDVPARERGRALSDRPYSLSRDPQAARP